MSITAQRRTINARLDKADEDIKTGRTRGPFASADEMIADIKAQLKARAAAKKLNRAPR